MPFKCSALNCKGNYKNGPKVSVFRFPSNELEKLKWLKFLGREDDFTITNNSRLCEKHFRREQVKKNNNKAELLPGSIPSISTLSDGCEEIFSNNSTSTGRENVFTKVLKSDQQQFEIGIVESITTFNEYQKKNFFSTLTELRVLLLDDNETFTVGGKYQILDQESKILFLQIESEPIPKIQYSLVIAESLDVSVYGDVCEFKSVGVHRFPTKVSAVNELSDILKLFAGNDFKTSHQSDILKTKLNSAVQNLTEVRDLINDDDKQQVLDFILQQCKLLMLSQSQYRYNSDFIVLFSILYTISPHAYKYIRKSKCLILPHPRTLEKVFATFSSNPVNESVDALVLDSNRRARDRSSKNKNSENRWQKIV